MIFLSSNSPHGFSVLRTHLKHPATLSLSRGDGTPSTFRIINTIRNEFEHRGKTIVLDFRERFDRVASNFSRADARWSAELKARNERLWVKAGSALISKIYVAEKYAIGGRAEATDASLHAPFTVTRRDALIDPKLTSHPVYRARPANGTWREDDSARLDETRSRSTWRWRSTEDKRYVHLLDGAIRGRQPTDLRTRAFPARHGEICF